MVISGVGSLRAVTRSAAASVGAPCTPVIIVVAPRLAILVIMARGVRLSRASLIVARMAIDVGAPVPVRGARASVGCVVVIVGGMTPRFRAGGGSIWRALPGRTPAVLTVACSMRGGVVTVAVFMVAPAFGGMVSVIVWLWTATPRRSGSWMLVCGAAIDRRSPRVVPGRGGARGMPVVILVGRHACGSYSASKGSPMPTDRMESQERGPAGSRQKSLYEDEDDSIKMCLVVRVWRLRTAQCKTATVMARRMAAMLRRLAKRDGRGRIEQAARKLGLEGGVERRATGTSDDEISRAEPAVQAARASRRIFCGSRQQKGSRSVALVGRAAPTLIFASHPTRDFFGPDRPVALSSAAARRRRTDPFGGALSLSPFQDSAAGAGTRLLAHKFAMLDLLLQRQSRPRLWPLRGGLCERSSSTYRERTIPLSASHHHENNSQH